MGYSVYATASSTTKHDNYVTCSPILQDTEVLLVYEDVERQ